MINESHANAVPSHYRPARRVASPSHCRQSVRNAIGSLFGAQCVQWPVAVEKLILTKCSEISSHQDALEATSSTRVDIFYPQICACFLRKRLFQHPRDYALTESRPDLQMADILSVAPFRHSPERYIYPKCFCRPHFLLSQVWCPDRVVPLLLRRIWRAAR